MLWPLPSKSDFLIALKHTGHPADFSSKQLRDSKCSNTRKLKWKWIGDLSLISATCSWHEQNYSNFLYQKSYFQIKWVRPSSFSSPWATDSCSYYAKALISVCCSALRAYLKWLNLKAKLSANVDEQGNGSRREKFTQSYSHTKHTGSHSSEEESVTCTLKSITSYILHQPNLDLNLAQKNNKINRKDSALCIVCRMPGL